MTSAAEERAQDAQARAQDARARVDEAQAARMEAENAEMMGMKADPTMPGSAFGGMGTLSPVGLRAMLDVARDERGLLMGRLVCVETEIMALERLVG